MLAAPGQPVHIRTQGLHGWERSARSLGKGIADVLEGGGRLWELSERVTRTGELAAFTEELRGISAEVGEELKEQEIRDWDYSWKAAITPRIHEAVAALSPESRDRALEMARLYSAQSSIEARRAREVQRIATARERWEQQLEASISSGQEEQAARWVEAARGVFVPEDALDGRVEEARSRACRSRLEARLEASPLEALAEMAEHAREGKLPVRTEEGRLLEQSCRRARHRLRRELSVSFSDRLREGEEIEPAALGLAARAGIIPAAPERAEEGEPAAPSLARRSEWRRWLDAREEGEESELDARLAIASASLPLAERRALLAHLERTQKVPAADRRALSNRLFVLYNSGAFGCPGDAEAERALLRLQEEGAALLGSQGAEAAARWLDSRRAAADNWVCFEAGQQQSVSARRKD